MVDCPMNTSDSMENHAMEMMHNDHSEMSDSGNMTSKHVFDCCDDCETMIGCSFTVSIQSSMTNPKILLLPVYYDHPGELLLPDNIPSSILHPPISV